MGSGRSNYVAWNFRILRILNEKDLFQVLEETSNDKSTIDEATRNGRSDQAFTIISINIGNFEIPHIQTARTAKEAWESLAKVH